MSLIIIVYLLLQLAAALFLFFQLQDHLDSLIIQTLLTLFTSSLYMATHFKNPGYVDYEYLHLNADKVSQSTPSVSEGHMTAPKIVVHSQTLKIQKKYCKFCKQDQFIRMKHCYDCKKCVATFDHHCFWLDNCIGQKNRPIFFVYIVFQLFQVIYPMIAMILKMIYAGQKYTFQIVFLSFLGILGSAIGVLVFLHGYLMLANLTTWEVSRWDKIYYLEGCSKQKSPFDKGVIENIKQYWSSCFSKDYKIWTICYKNHVQANRSEQ